MKTINQVIEELNPPKVETPPQPPFPIDDLKRTILLLGDLINLSLKQFSAEIRGSNEEIKQAIINMDMPEQTATDISPIVSSIESLQGSMNPEVTVQPTPIDLSPVVEALAKLETQPVSMPEIDLSPLAKQLTSLEKAIKAIKLPTPAPISLDLTPVMKAIQSLEKKLEPTPIDLTPVKEATENVEVAIRSLRFPVPTPVTQIDINPLRGSFKTTAVTVTSAATALPTTAQTNRRTVIVYNNDASVSIFLGGSTVTSSTGVPVAAGSYSPPFDIGASMTLYGITAAASVNVRVLEVSNDAVGSG